MSSPSNICIDCVGTLKVIDFGLSKKYVDDAGSIMAQRLGKAGFRGSTAYASLYAHEEQELGRNNIMQMSHCKLRCGSLAQDTLAIVLFV